VRARFSTPTAVACTTPRTPGNFSSYARRVGRIEHDLRHAIAVAEVDEQAAAVVAVGVDPTAEGDDVAHMNIAKFAAGVSSEHCFLVWVDEWTG
jgi:hypothetical protein